MSDQMKLLVVDDDPDYQRLAKSFIEQLGHACVLADNGKEAVERYLQERPDVVLMDILMPSMDGIEAAAAILSEDFEAPIVFVSVLDDFPGGTPPEIASLFEIFEKPKSVKQMNTILNTLMSVIQSR